jgi:hypothetical protein
MRIIQKNETINGYMLIRNLYYLIEERKIYKSIKENDERRYIIKEIDKLIIKISDKYLKQEIGDERNVI